VSSKDLWRVRKRRLRFRQAAIFGLLVAGLAVVGVASVAMFLGRMEPLISAPFSSPSPKTEDFGPVPCPADESSMYPQAGMVTVNVLNGSDINFAATYLAQALERRGFGIGRIGNAPIDYSGVALIRAGAKGMSRAYLLLGHAPDGTVLSYSDRTDETVDIIIGDQYDSLRPLEEVAAQAGTVIPFPPECTPLAEVAAAGEVPLDPVGTVDGAGDAGS
jgi:hypothetical protein